MKKSFITLVGLVLGTFALFAQEQVPLPPAAPKSPYKDYTIQKSGFWWGGEVISGAALNFDPADNIKPVVPLQADVVLGYRFNEFIQVGGGFGFRYYFMNPNARAEYIVKDNKDKTIAPFSVPIFVDARGVMISGRSRDIVPCWSFDVGYAINDGFMVAPMVGLRFGYNERHHFILGLTYMAQQTILKHEPVQREDASWKPGFLHILGLKLAYEF